MKTDLIILQKNINVDHERMMNCLFLVFMENGSIIGTGIVQLPRWFVFWSKEYQYYPPCYN